MITVVSPAKLLPVCLVNDLMPVRVPFVRVRRVRFIWGGMAPPVDIVNLKNPCSVRTWLGLGQVDRTEALIKDYIISCPVAVASFSMA